MIKQLLKEIKAHDKIIIHRHQRPDGDALGSQWGLATILQENFPEKVIVCVGSKEEYQHNFLKDIFKEDFGDIDEDFYTDAMVIVTDTANVDRIEGQNFFRGNVIFKIDHHVSAEEFGTHELVLDDVSSASEIITNIARELKLEVSKKAAKYLLTGMMTDTGRFMFNSVTPKTFETVYFLTSQGAKVFNIAQQLNDRDINFVRLQGEILSCFQIKNGVAYYMMPKGLHSKFNVPYETASSLVFLLMSFKEANYALFASYDSKNKVWKASMRSRKHAINEIAEQHDGGGHKMAAGLKLQDKKEFNEVLEKLVKLSKKK